LEEIMFSLQNGRYLQAVNQMTAKKIETSQVLNEVMEWGIEGIIPGFIDALICEISNQRVVEQGLRNQGVIPKPLTRSTQNII
jgi:hypothetical protein